MTESTPPRDRPAWQRAIRRIDDAIYAVEGTIIVAFVSLMTFMVSADVLQRRVVDPRSSVGALIVRMFGIDDPDTRAFLETSGGSYLSLAVFIALLIFGFYSAERRREELGEGFSIKRVIIGSIIGLAISGAIILIIGNPDIPSRYLFAIIFLLSGIGGIVMSLKNAEGHRVMRSLAILIGTAAFIYLSLEYVPPGYTWSKKLSLLLALWVAFLGSSMCARDGRHLRIEAITKLVPDPIVPYANALGAMATTIVCFFFAYLVSVEIFDPQTGVRALGEHIEMTSVPTWFRIFSAVVGFTVIGIRYIAIAIAQLTGGDYGKAAGMLDELLEGQAASEDELSGAETNTRNMQEAGR